MLKFPVVFRNLAAPAIKRGLSGLPSENIGELLSQVSKWNAPPRAKLADDIVGVKGNYALKLGDFPAEPLYTLLKNGKKVRELNSLPESWTLPKLNKTPFPDL